MRTHGLLCSFLQNHHQFPKSPSHLHRLSHLLSSQNDLEETQTLKPEREQRQEGDGKGGKRVEISHPWPEWMELMDCIIKKGYLDPGDLQRRDSAAATTITTSSKDSNHIRTACLNFARDRFDLIRNFSKEDIQAVVGSGCPSLDRKVVNSGKRLRAHVGIKEGNVCRSCNLRGSCERAYMEARGDEGGRTVDVMRILLTYGLDLISGSVENQASLHKMGKESARRLLNEMVEFSIKEPDSAPRNEASSRLPSNFRNLIGHPKGQVDAPMKQGDWICPKCSFLNFAKNIKCLRCNSVSQERLKKLQEDCEHLPMKKGDWRCDKCNFLNFARNTKCFLCQERPPKRQLNPGEWECVSCNYLNFRRNMVCLKCDWKRPKASNSGDMSAQFHPDNQGHHKNSRLASARNSKEINGQHFGRQKSPTREEGMDFWSSDEDGGDDDNLDAWKNIGEFENFPIVGGKSAISQNPLERERWRGDMSKRSRGVSGGRVEVNDGGSGSACFARSSVDESSDEDGIAGWFRCESGDVQKHAR